jgi:pimeloyl-ACP methyl ester carboxylesterase
MRVYDSIKSHTKEWVTKSFHWMTEHKLTHATQVLSLLILDFKNAVKISAHSIKGMKKEYHPYHLNPQTISPEQAQLPPTLLIHGYMHNQGVWVTMAKHLEQREDLGPLFTITLPNIGGRKAQRQALETKMREIKALYKEAGNKNPNIQLVAYSDGGYAAISFLKKSASSLKERVSKLVLVGCHLGNYDGLGLKLQRKTVAINAKHEFLDPAPSMMPSNKTTEINTTHLGLVHSAETAEAIYKNIRVN